MASFALTSYLKYVIQIKQFLPFRFKSLQAMTFSTSSVDLESSSNIYHDHQSTLPRLPIPSLQSLKQRYLDSIKPLIKNEEEFKLAAENINEFIHGIGQELQYRLIQYDSTQPYSWLKNIWLEKGYHSLTLPLLPFSNWWMYFKDPLISSSKVPFETNEGKSLFSAPQIHRTISVIYSSLQYKRLCDSGKIPPSQIYTKVTPLCVRQYFDMFGITRIPSYPSDQLRVCDGSKHIIIMIEDQFYRAKVYDENNSIKSPLAIKELLVNIMTYHRHPARSSQPPLSILTALHRDDWRRIRQEMIRNVTNCNNLQNIEDSLFVISLESESPSSFDDAIRKCFLNSSNRWYDKSLNFIVFPNGQAGMVGEHSPCDALIVSRLVEYILSMENDWWDSQEKKDALLSEKTKSSSINLMEDVKHLQWDISSTLAFNLRRVETELELWWSWLPFTVLDYGKFGSDAMKSAKIKPDSFIQAALLLTYYKMNRRLPVTYEAAATYKFLHGRTDTIRVLSLEAADFVLQFDKLKEEHPEKAGFLLNKFVQAHSEYTNAATNGLGIDRHLLGLKSMMSPIDPIPKLFEDPIFIRSTHWDLSTSNMSPGTAFQGLGFGPVYPECIGVNYCISNHRLLFSISAWEKATSDSKINAEYPFDWCPRLNSEGLLITKGKNDETYPLVNKMNTKLFDESNRAHTFKRLLLGSLEDLESLLVFINKKSTSGESNNNLPVSKL